MKDFFKQYIPYYKDYKLKFFYAFIGMALVAGGTSGAAYVVKPLLDEIFIAKDLTKLYTIPALVIGLYFAKGLGKYVQAYYISFIGQDIIRKVRDKLLKHTLTLDIEFFQKKHGGELISRITNDINKIQSAVSSQIAEFIKEFLTIFALIFVVIYQSAEMAFYGLIVMPLAIFPLSRLAKKMKKLSFDSQEKISNITTHLSETFNNIEIIKANSTEQIETEKFEDHNKKYFHVSIKAVKTNELVSPIMETLGALAIATVIILGGTKVIEGELTVGEFFSFMTALFMLYTPIKTISSLYNKMQGALAANERINELFSVKSNIISGNEKLNEDIKEITFNDICLNYDEIPALKNINLHIKKGETLALVGDSGGGKSSLVNLIIRFYDAHKGEIKFNNHNIRDIDIKSLRDIVSIVTQRVYIFNDTVCANIAYGQEINEQKVIEALKQAHAYDFVNSMEKGIHTKLDEFGTNLSGGQRQRIAIARALYKNPQILILDEATSALDNESESIISEVIDEISKDKITFIIAHRLSTIKHATNIAVFKKGQIVCIGNEQKLKNECEEYKRLHNLANI
ncbi:ABC transporter ATP-binding protein [Malaciobacter mytili]|uniref:ABC transporter permease n=1 Tax=Malaciobacter mytili LMG 24559 TaxID=1032238 RepID=A0AAX2ACK2_9BACT|nr:ABC transporter ATP-binding protein [Malaciobacter mytili]AXH15421.1 lipid A export ATP-binding/permease protein [Malaciobacter mytili LMG 24559]RXI41829.1 ABC transporter permease [Malaciobacter mytili]RXK14717.1 ABC transporter permease [Malaciobacter mytili LMG 24559]